MIQRGEETSRRAMAPPALNLAGSARFHAKFVENGSTPARSFRIRPGPVVVATCTAVPPDLQHRRRLSLSASARG
ncbi:hypothetical protein ZWY2020_012241 [Hordeum vulgare]|nr:hypothetical protein ZWY2020_012241 [Hordeum vulgare]